MTFRREALDIRHRLPDLRGQGWLLRSHQTAHIRGYYGPERCVFALGNTLALIAMEIKKRDCSPEGKRQLAEMALMVMERAKQKPLCDTRGAGDGILKLSGVGVV